MKKLFISLVLILAVVLRIPEVNGVTVGLLLGVGSVFLLYLYAHSLPFAQKFPYFASICALFLAISSWHIAISQYPNINLYIFFTTLGVYILFRIFKKYSFLVTAIFLMTMILIANPVKVMLSGFSNSQVPIWLTDEQRREHGQDYNYPFVVLVHNKVINYSLSFLDHYTQHFQGDFLFISGDVRGNFGQSGQMYLFDFIFIMVSLIVIIRNPKGWGIIFIWLLLAPIPSALDLQPPNAAKAANMLIPLIILSSFGASRILKIFLKRAIF